MASDTIEQALFVTLNASTHVVSAARANRAYFMRTPSTEDVPYISFATVDGGNLAGAFNSTGHGEDTAQPLIQFDIWDNDRFKANLIAHDLIKVLNRSNAAMDGMNVVNIECRGPRQLNDPDYDNLYHFVVEADIEYERK